MRSPFRVDVRLLRFVSLALWASCFLLRPCTFVAAKGMPQSLVFWFSETIEHCGFTIPSSFMLGLGRLDEEHVAVSWSGACSEGMVAGQGTLRGVQNGLEIFSFTGTMVAGAFDGGVRFVRTDATVSASFHRGILSGPVTVTGPGEARYEGGWGEKGPEGYGTRVQAGGGRYEGDWHDGHRTGTGVFIWPSGSRYDGQWFDGVRTGHGQLVDALGNRFEGEFKGGKRNGHGTQYYTNGVRLEADWVDDAVAGPVSIIGPTGARYDGSFRDGGPEGQGVAIEVNGDRYEGEWHDALPNGTGTLIRKADGSEFSGRWNRGCFFDGSRHAAFHMDEALCTDH